MRKFFRCLAVDFKSGLSATRTLLVLLPFVVVAVVAFSILRARATGYEAWPETFGDVFACVFGGIRQYDPSLGEEFAVPSAWLLTLMYLLFIPLSFPYRDMGGMGRSTMLASESRLVWWLSKAWWVCGWTALVYALALLVLALCSGVLSCALDTSLCEITPYVLGFYETLDAGGGNVMRFVALALLVIEAMSLAQFTFSLFVGPVFAFATNCVSLLASAYFSFPWLPGSYLMLGRVLDGSMGPFATELGIAVSVLSILAALCVGAWRFSTMDMLEKEVAHEQG